MFCKFINPRSITLTVLVLSSLVNTSFGQQFWQPTGGNEIPYKGERKIVPEQYKTFSLNENEMRAFLGKLNGQPQVSAILELPTPTGQWMRFNIRATCIFPPALQAKYPGIQTFSAVATDNPYITAKIDFTLYGFHAMVFGQEAGVWIVDPYSNRDDGYYISYYQQNAPSNPGKAMVCDNKTGMKNLNISGIPTNIGSKPGNRQVIQQRASENIKRTYHLALSCTGEYAVAIADTINAPKAAILSAMTTTINRVNGIYEREFDVTMVFINQEDDLIYTDTATDPFSANNDGGILLGQNQTNTDNVIGNSNYDIGHIFSTGGGGIAWLGSVCNSNSKAKGVTGLANPTGDAFSVDYVSHEMGHQFGADHTFNDCNGNEWAPTAYEPGSGSTIMAYAGICGPENDLQAHSDDYFHAISLIEVSDFLASNWNSCATTQNISVDIPSFGSIQQNYTIPAATPFELVAPTASTGNPSDSLSYCWEQWNLGDLQQPEDSDAHFVYGPIFRTEYPKHNNPVRVFPDLTDLVQNQRNTPGERLPLVSRELAFKLTVRNMENGWGSFQISDDSLHVKVVNTGSPFKVTLPDTSGLAYQANATMNVNWDVSGTQNAPISCSKVDIYLSTDGGYTYPYMLATGLPNNGQAMVQLPNVNTQQGRIKVKGHDNIFFDISNNNFKTSGATGIVNTAFYNAIKVYPNPASEMIEVSTTFPGEVQAILFDQLGKKVWQGKFKKHQSIATGNFSRGIYLLRLSNQKSGLQTSRKITLQ